VNIPRWFILTVGAVTLAVWVAAFIASVFVPGYKPDPVIGYAAMAVVAACFGSDAARRAIAKAKNLVKSNEAGNDEQRPNERDSGANRRPSDSVRS
jgi:lipopolysaccharide export LptBFGC system permease protein LptF